MRVPAWIWMVSLCWLAYCAVAFSNAGSDLLLSVGAIAWACSWMLGWAIRVLLFGARKRRAFANARPCRHWLVEPLALALGIALSVCGAFAWLRFALSEQALDRYVQDVRAGRIQVASDAPPRSRRVGLYDVGVTECLPDGTVRFATSTAGLFDVAGFASSPDNPPSRLGGDSYVPIRGTWSYWYQHW